MNHLYALKSSNNWHLAKSANTKGHLVCGEYFIPVEYSAAMVSQVGQYNSGTCEIGYVSVCPIGMPFKDNYFVDVVTDAQAQIQSNEAAWMNANHKPHFIACCGQTGLGCCSNYSLGSVACACGIYISIPKFRYNIPEDVDRDAITGARLRFNGYSDFVIEAQKVDESVENCAFSMKSFRLNNSVTGYKNTAGQLLDWNVTGRSTDLIIAHASTNPDALTLKQLFMATFHDKYIVSPGEWYDMVINGKESIGTQECSTNLDYWLGSRHMSEQYNPTYCGYIGTNAYPNGGSTLNYTNAYPFSDANSGTKNHINTYTGGSYGQEFANTSGTVWKQNGGHYYRTSELNTTAKADTSWNVKPYIELRPWQLTQLKQAGYIWVTYANPAPFFTTTHTYWYMGLSRQIWIEGCRLELLFD